MASIGDWFVEEKTLKQVYEGLYPVMISSAKYTTKEAEKDDKTFTREVVELTFKTLQDVPFPDGTAEKITVTNSYYKDVQFHLNALSGIARAFGVGKFVDTADFEGKVGIIGIINNEYEKEGETKYAPKLGYGLFSYAPLPPQGANIEYIGNEIQGKPSEEEYKDWFKKHLANYKQVK